MTEYESQSMNKMDLQNSVWNASDKTKQASFLLVFSM